MTVNAVYVALFARGPVGLRRDVKKKKEKKVEAAQNLFSILRRQTRSVASQG